MPQNHKHTIQGKADEREAKASHGENKYRYESMWVCGHVSMWAGRYTGMQYVDMWIFWHAGILT